MGNILAGKFEALEKIFPTGEKFPNMPSMKKVFWVFVAFMTAMAGQGNAMPDQAAPKVIVALGDSTTAGTPGFSSPREAPPEGKGNPESQYAFWIMKKHPEWNILNRGVRGQRSDQILARFEYDVLRFNPEAVVILAGVNDLHQGRTVLETQASLEKLYARASEAKLKTLLCTILPYDLSTPEVAERIRAVNVWIEAYAKKHGFLFCDTYKSVVDPNRPGKLIESPDRIHPGVEGYRRMAEALLPALEELFKEGKS